MKLPPATLLFALLLIPQPSTALAADGARFLDRLTAGGVEMHLIGAGGYEKWFFDVFANALYLPPDVPAEQALDEVPRCLLFHYFRDISAEQFAQAGKPFLRDNLAPENLQRLEPQLEKMRGLYQSVQEGDRYRLCYLPGTGTTLLLNGKPLGTVSGSDFARAYFQIWLGEHSVSNELRDKLLGREE